MRPCSLPGCTEGLQQHQLSATLRPRNRGGWSGVEPWGPGGLSLSWPASYTGLGDGSLPSSPQPLRIPGCFCPIRPAKDGASPWSHDLCLPKGEPLKRQGGARQNSSTLGSASISWKAWEGRRVLSAKLQSKRPRESHRT